jgi:serine phosphatase RsbU (regulator of sigma subunit)
VVAEQLLRLVHQHMHRLEHSALLSELSDSLPRVKANCAAPYATALVLGFDSSSGNLVFTNAGHPPPLWYSAMERRWRLLEKPRSAKPERAVGLPIGLGLESDYEVNPRPTPSATRGVECAVHAIRPCRGPASDLQER